MRNVRQEGCRTRGIYDRKGAGHEEYTTGGCRILGIYDRKVAGHEEYTTGGVQDMRNA